MTDTFVGEQSTMCVDCGALVLSATVRLSSGTLVTCLVESPHEPVTGWREALQIALDDGQWVVDERGQFIEHSLDRCHVVAAGQ